VAEVLYLVVPSACGLGTYDDLIQTSLLYQEVLGWRKEEPVCYNSAAMFMV
jgi:hypothetical protein